jgi:hypothetical protein
MQEKMWILMSKREISCTHSTSILQRKQIFQNVQDYSQLLTTVEQEA